MILFHKRLLVLLLTLLPIVMLSQEFNFKNLTTELALPSQETYFVFQDSKGYVWVSTEFGLMKYNGNQSQLIDLKSNHINEAVYAIHEDSKGIIRLVTSKQRLLEYSNENIVEPQYSKKLVSLINNPKDFIYSIVMVGNELILNSKYQTYGVNLTKGSTLIHSKTEKNSLNDRKSLCYLIKSKDKKNFTPLKINFDLNVDGKKNVMQKVNLDLLDWRNRTLKIKDTYYLSLGNLLLVINSNGDYTIQKFPNLILSLNQDAKEGLYIGLFKNGLRYYPNPTDFQNYIHSLENFSVSSSIIDYEGNLWCSTLEKGIYFCANREVLIYNKYPDFRRKANLLKTVNDKVFISTHLNDLSSINKTTVNISTLKLEVQLEMTDFDYFEGKYYLTNKAFLSSSKNGIDFKKIKLKGLYRSFFQLTKYNNKLYALNGEEILEIKNDSIIDINKKLNIIAKKFIGFTNSDFLIGGQNGLYLSDFKNNKLKKFKGIESEITVLAKDQIDNYWIGTKGEGLFILQKNKLRRKIIAKNNNPKYITDIKIANNIVWVTTNIGLFKLGSKIEKIDYKDGLLSNDCNKIVLNENIAYVSSVDGLCSFNSTTNFKNYVVPKFYLKKINNKKAPSRLSKINLNYDYTKLDLEFDILSFKKSEDNSLVYKIIGLNECYKSTNHHIISLENLPPNRYTLVVHASNSGFNSKTKPILIELNINKPYWDTWWFKLLSFVIAALLFFMLYTIKIKKIKQKEAEKTKLNNLISQSQLKALQAQMNPHFIFNAINSIQKFILNNNQNEAYKYLSKFSKLIRLVLENSEENTITIEEEIKMLELYINLEQLRFKNKFKSVIILDDAIDANHFYIPTMIIQPHIENAIWHGIMNLEEHQKGVLTISFKQINSHKIIITIEDNGVGREKTSNNSIEKNHKSFGHQLINKRIDIINKNEKSEHKITLSVEDLFPTKNPTGTKVSIEIITL